MGTIFDSILNQVGNEVIRFVGKSTNDVFTPSSFSFTGDDVTQNSENAIPADFNQLALVGASGIGLAATAGIIVVGTAIQSQLKAINSKINLALGKLESIDKKMDKLLAITKRIDLKVSESHLRESIKHHLRTSINEDGVDLASLSELEDDIVNMLESLDDGILGNSSIKLSSDVRALLESIYMLFSSSRIAFTTAYNNRHSSIPVPLISVDKINAYYLCKDIDDVASSVVRINALILELEKLRENSLQLINTRFTFSDDDDKNHMNSVFDDFHNQSIELFGDRTDLQVWRNLPSELFQGESTKENIESYLNAWTWRTDAGLLRRLQLELGLYKIGYDGFLDDKNEADTKQRELTIQVPFRLLSA